MGYYPLARTTISLLPMILLSSLNLCLAATQPTVLTYHNGSLLSGNLSFNIIWYGKFTPFQRSILIDFLYSLHPTYNPAPKPSVSQWWRTLETYHTFIPTKPHRFSPNTNNAIVLKVHKQTRNESYPLGRFLTRTQISRLAEKGSGGGDVVLVFTAHDVAVEGFCMSSCGHHGSVPKTRVVYVWVGNSVSQCPGQCAWPFHQPIYWSQSPPLVAPNGDVGVDGMVIGLASMLAAAVTNPFGNGFFQGPASAPLEAASACLGIYGSRAFPGYAGKLLVDGSTGGSYNAHGVGGRKFLLPALWDPLTSSCLTLV